MRKNKAIKKQMEKDCGIRLRELCEVLNPPEYRRKNFFDGQIISEVAASVGEMPNFILNEIRLKRLKATVVNRKVRILKEAFLSWLALD